MERSGPPILFLEDANSFFRQKRLGRLVVLRGHAESVMYVVRVASIGVDRFLGMGEHEAVSTCPHEDHVVVAPQPLHSHDLGIEPLRPVEVLHRDREMNDTLRLQHPDDRQRASTASSKSATMLVILIIGLTAGPAVSL